MCLCTNSPFSYSSVPQSIHLLEHFTNLPDHRIDRTKRHKLIDIVGVSICAVVCGAEGWTAIEEYVGKRAPDHPQGRRLVRLLRH